VEPEANGLADPPLNTVANHCFTDRSGHGKADFWSLAIGPAGKERRKQWSGIPGTVIINSAEINGSQNTDTFGKTCAAHYLSELTVNFLRPLARRRERTARPSAVSMRVRNPCVF